MPKTYTATEVLEMGRECLGEMEKRNDAGYESTAMNIEVSARNALRTLALERLEKRLADKK